MAIGRPSKLNDDLKHEICLRIADGETVRQIASSDHMPAAQNIYLALVRDADFRDRYAFAREAQLERWEDEIVEIADDGTNDWIERENKDGSKYEAIDHEHITRSKLRVDARKWLMSKRAPRKYGERLVHAGDGPKGEIVQRIERVIVDPANPDATGVRPTAGRKPV